MHKLQLGHCFYLAADNADNDNGISSRLPTYFFTLHYLLLKLNALQNDKKSLKIPFDAERAI